MRVATLPIVWQRLVSEGVTCPRCAGTETEVERAVTILGETVPASLIVKAGLAAASSLLDA